MAYQQPCLKLGERRGLRQLQNGFPFRFLFWFCCLEIIQKWPAHISSPMAPVSPWHHEFEECWWLWCWLVCATSTTPLCFHILEAGTSDLHSEAEELFRRFFVYRNSHVPTQKNGAWGWKCLYFLPFLTRSDMSGCLFSMSKSLEFFQAKLSAKLRHGTIPTFAICRMRCGFGAVF